LKIFENLKLHGVVKIIIYLALLTGLYYSAYTWLIRDHWSREDYNYCYLIPLIVLYLIWEKKDELAAEDAVPSWAGLLFLIPGVLLFWIGDLAGELYTTCISSWLVSIGLLWMHIGWRQIKIIAFPIFFALTMFPMPYFLHNKLTFGLKLISSQLGVALLHLWGMSAYREGNVIDLGFTQLQVVDACSGLRYLFPLLVMGILLAYFYRAALWKRLVLVISTVPLTIMTNSLRIALTGVIYKHWGAKAAEGFFHGFSGWLIFMFTLGILLAEIWVLRRIAPSPSESFFARPEPTASVRAIPLRQSGAGGSKAFISPPQFVVAAVLLVLTLGISLGVDFREKIPISKPFSQFPLAVGTWEGTREFMEQKFITELDLSDYTIINYKNATGQNVNFYVAYYESQRKGESIHSPETCLPGGGWLFHEAGTVQVPLMAPGETIKVNRAIMEKSGYQQLVYFWFPARGRVLTNAWEMKLYTFWDSLTRQRTDGALVRVITLVYPGEAPEQAETRLQSFVKDITPVLNEFLPK
jgi:exosortase D (VPLPA-CTERM-specific)